MIAIGIALLVIVALDAEGAGDRLGVGRLHPRRARDRPGRIARMSRGAAEAAARPFDPTMSAGEEIRRNEEAA
jgi:hypothetical protein